MLQIRSSENDTDSPWGSFLRYKLLPGNKQSTWENGRYQSCHFIHYCFQVFFLPSLQVSPEMGLSLRSILVLSFLFFSCRGVDRSLSCIFTKFKAKIPEEDISHVRLRPSDYGTCGLSTRETFNSYILELSAAQLGCELSQGLSKGTCNLLDFRALPQVPICCSKTYIPF